MLHDTENITTEDKIFQMLSIWLCWMLFRSLYKMLLQETQHQGRRILAHLQLPEVKAVGEIDDRNTYKERKWSFVNQTTPPTSKITHIPQELNIYGGPENTV